MSKRITYRLANPEMAQWIADMLAPNWTVTPEGREVSLRAEGDAVAYLRDLPEDYDGHIDADGVMWVGGTGYAPSERRRVKIRKYGSLPSMAYWSAYDADDDTQQPLLPSYTGRRKRDVVQIVTNNGWEIVR